MVIINQMEQHHEYKGTFGIFGHFWPDYVMEKLEGIATLDNGMDICILGSH